MQTLSDLRDLLWECNSGGRRPRLREVEDMWSLTERLLRQQDGGPSLESGWLVENDNGGPCWWGRTPDGEDAFGWTKDSLMALRFARKEDAEAYIEEIGWNDVVATEHQWQ